MRRALIVLAIVAATFLAPRGASAGAATSTSYAVISFQVDGTSDATVHAQVEKGLVRGVAEAGADLIGYQAVQTKLASTPALVGCVSATCLAGIARAIGTDQMLEVKITANGANYQLELVLVGPSGAPRKRTGACTVCTVADLADLAATRVTDLLTATAGGPLAVSITSRPAGAALSISGVGAATAPWSGQLAPGKVVVDARLRGYRDLHQELTVVDDGSDQRFELALRAITAAPRWHRVKWATAGGGAAAIITSIVLLSLDGNPTCSDAHALCPRVYTTGLSGGVFGILGLAAAGTAGWMFWQDHSHHDATVSAAATSSAASASLRVRF